MPRRVYTYVAETGWGSLNLLATAGVFLMVAGSAVFLFNVARTLLRGEPAGPNPWGAESLEWATSSPPPAYNFGEIPVVHGRSPLWEWGEERPVATGLRSDRREALVTSVVDALPQYRQVFVRDSVMPFLAALATGVTFIGGMFTPWGFVAGGVLGFVAVTKWFWPDHWKVQDEATRGA